MKRQEQFNFNLKILYSLLLLSLSMLFLMSLSRYYLYHSYSQNSIYSSIELFNAFLLGFRLDLSIIAYINILPVIYIIVLYAIKKEKLNSYAIKVLTFYFIAILFVIYSFTFMDYIYFSFFAEHSTIMIFGVLDDDTSALISTAFSNYNVPLFTAIFITLYILVVIITIKILKNKKMFSFFWTTKKQILFFIFLVISIGLLARGSLGLFPLAKYIPDVSADSFINKLPQTPTYALVYAYKQYKKSKSGKYDLIKMVGYKGKITDAFKDHLGINNINKEDLLQNIKYQTTKNTLLKDKPPHVVVVMVESFGMPLLKYQSDTFNIMGKLKKHFEEDILFTNFISSSNGTISSLEALLLNIPSRPKGTSFSQSNYLNTSFKQASARVYQDAGYETTFIYGGDLSWRNVGSFMSRQGFDKVEGKAQIIGALNLDSSTKTHDWGVYDEYSYTYLLNKLENATKPQFIFLLTTNNHPPYKVPTNYKSNKLILSQELKSHITGDIDLAQKRFKDYAYAVDMAGNFLDKLKVSPIAQKTVVAITADNNTVEGIMKYDEHYTNTKKVPFYLYLPNYLKKKTFDTTIPASHKDIFPTLYHATLSNVAYTSIGNNLQNNITIQCGFNKAGVIISRDGGFKSTNPKTEIQKNCLKHYKSSLAVTEYMIKSHK